MSERSFEPTIMFFRLTSSLVVFQTMINKILRNLINTRKVASFIDNIIVVTEKEKRYDKVVERLAKNDLYIKPEKYK